MGARLSPWKEAERWYPETEDDSLPNKSNLSDAPNTIARKSWATDFRPGKVPRRNLGPKDREVLRQDATDCDGDGCRSGFSHLERLAYIPACRSGVLGMRQTHTKAVGSLCRTNFAR